MWKKAFQKAVYAQGGASLLTGYRNTKSGNLKNGNLKMREYIISGYPVREIRTYNQKTGYNVVTDWTFKYTTPEATLLIEYELQPTGFGYKPLLVCPRCHSTRAKLYAAGSFVFCRACFKWYKPYHGRQNTTKGGSDRVQYSMEKLARKHGIEDFSVGLLTGDWILEDLRPRYMRKASFADLLGRLYLLDDIRCRLIMSRFLGGLKADDTFITDIESKATPAQLMSYPIYADTIAEAEDFYRLPIKQRLLDPIQRKDNIRRLAGY